MILYFFLWKRRQQRVVTSNLHKGGTNTLMSAKALDQQSMSSVTQPLKGTQIIITTKNKIQPQHAIQKRSRNKEEGEGGERTEEGEGGEAGAH